MVDTPQQNDEHHRVPQAMKPGDLRIVARCACGWTSTPCSNGEFANQAWEQHAKDVGPTVSDASPQ